MKQITFIFVLLIIANYLCSTENIPEYTIQLQWDVMEGECNGVLSGKIGDNFGYVQGISKGSALNGRIVSIGETAIKNQGQVFEIYSSEGFFTFWVRDKFADDDMQADYELLANAKPIISIYKGNLLLRSFSLEKGYGLACKVFTLDAETGEILDAKRYFLQTKTISLQVIDAVSGKPIKDVSVLLSGGDEQSQNKLTDIDGFLWFNVEIGAYRLNLTKKGYISTSYPVEMRFDENPVEYVIAMTPEVKEYRIILTWGSAPKDLDAHLLGPMPEGGNFHIWYRNRVLIDGKDFLDRDDTDSYGPETITIYKPATGTYTYAVHDYTNKANSSSKNLSRSGAVVQIYADNKLLNTFQVPENQRGTIWRVFSIDRNHNIIQINSISYIKDERSLQP